MLFAQKPNNIKQNPSIDTDKGLHDWINFLVINKVSNNCSQKKSNPFSYVIVKEI